MTSSAEMHPVRLSNIPVKVKGVESRKSDNQQDGFLRDEAYTSIKSAIITGQLKPNQRLIEETIASGLGTSRTPVREALHKLEKEGLVFQLPTMGFAVKGVTEEEVEQVLDLQRILEGYAIRLATSRIREDEIRSLNGLICRQEDCLLDGDVKRFMRLDSEFHETIHRAAKHAQLYHLLQSLGDCVDRYRMIVFRSHANLHLSILDHKEIVSTMKAKNAQKSEELIAKHMVRANNFIRKRIRWARAWDDGVDKERGRMKVATRIYRGYWLKGSSFQKGVTIRSHTGNDSRGRGGRR